MKYESFYFIQDLKTTGQFIFHYTFCFVAFAIILDKQCPMNNLVVYFCYLLSYFPPPSSRVNKNKNHFLF